MSTLTAEALEHFRRLGREHRDACIKDGCQVQHDRQFRAVARAQHAERKAS